MSKQLEGFDVTLKAEQDISTKQYYFVEQTSTDEQIDVADGATDVIIGVLQNKPDDTGKEALVRILGHSKVVAGEDSISAGNVLGTTARGSAQAIAAGTDTTTYILGICTKGGASSEVIEMVLLAGPARAR